MVDAVRDDLDRVTVEIVRAMQAAVPAYASLTLESVRTVAQRTVAGALEALRDRPPPVEAQLREIGRTIEIRARQGVSVDDVVAGYRAAVEAFWAIFQARAGKADLGDADLLRATERIWRWDNRVMAHVALVHRSVEIELRRHDQSRTLDLLRALLLGSGGIADPIRRAADHGLSVDGSYAAFAARTEGSMRIEDLEREVLAFPACHPVVAGVIDGRLVGIVSGAPAIRSADSVVGVGPFGPLERIQRSFDHASRATEAAVALGKRGVFSFEDLLLHTLVVSEDAVGDLLVARHVSPVAQSRRSGPLLLRTVSEFLRQGRDVHRTAETLSVHPNSIRYRLRRFESLAGVDLAKTEDLARVWWALVRRGVDKREGSARP